MEGGGVGRVRWEYNGFFVFLFDMGANSFLFLVLFASHYLLWVPCFFLLE